MFESNDRKKLLQKQIEKKIEGEYGFSVIIVLRTTVELGKIIGNCPFLEKSVFKAADSAVGESLYVVLLLETSPQKLIERLNNYNMLNKRIGMIIWRFISITVMSSNGLTRKVNDFLKPHPEIQVRIPFPVLL